MRVQFNLLPDVKQEYLKAQRSKRTVMMVAAIVTGISFFLFFIMLSTVYVINRKQLNDSGKDIAKYSRELKNIPDINRILTVQSQLGSLTELHQNKVAVSRIYTFLPQLTPTSVYLGKLNIDFSTNSMEIGGTSDSQKTINTFIDTLKFTTYKINGEETKKRAFPYVVESSFGIDAKGASYTLKVQFEPDLFINSQKIELSVPSGLATTRSVLQDPANLLFNGATGEKPKEGQTP